MLSILATKITLLPSKEKIVLAALTVVAVATPMLYHSLGMKGIEFLPIFLCIALGGRVLSFKNLLLLVVPNPTINSILTRIPAVPVYDTLLFRR